MHPLAIILFATSVVVRVGVRLVRMHRHETRDGDAFRER
jgi:hypothetical protein